MYPICVYLHAIKIYCHWRFNLFCFSNVTINETESYNKDNDIGAVMREREREAKAIKYRDSDMYIDLLVGTMKMHE